MSFASIITGRVLHRSLYSYLRQRMSPPRWIFELSTETVTDPQQWPPRNANIAYDWNLPTNQVYRDDCNNDDRNAHFSPAFATARSRLDYNYHANLVPKRQLLQDSILARVAACSEKDEQRAVNSKQRPWIVFTAGE